MYIIGGKPDSSPTSPYKGGIFRRANYVNYSLSDDGSGHYSVSIGSQH